MAFSHNAGPAVKRAHNLEQSPSLEDASRDLRGWTAILALAASTALGLAGGAWLLDPTLAAESSFLALLAAAVLVPAFFLLGGRASVEAWIVPLLAVLAGWSLPTPLRGAVVVALLALALFAGLLRVERWSFARLLAAAIGLQALLRCELLLESFASLLVGWLLLPLLAACAVALLERESRSRGLVAAAAILASSGGLTPLASTALAAAAAARWAVRRGAVVPVAAAGLVVAGVALTTDLGAPVEVVLVAVGAVLVAGLPLERAQREATSSRPSPWAEWGRWWGALVLVAAAVLPLLAPSRPWSAVTEELSWLLLLLPLLVTAALAAERRGALLRTLALALVALRALEPPRALPIVLVLAAFAVPVRDLATSRAVSAVLLAGTTLLGAYPWLRDEPLAALFGAFGITPGWGLALAAAALASLSSRVPRARRPVALGIVALLLVLLALTGPYSSLHRWPPITLTASAPQWRLETIEGTTTELLVDTTLANSAALLPGTKVGEVRLERGPAPPDARIDARFTLRVGRETGEWAAGRADLRHLETPAPWLETVAPTGAFFARRYRARFVAEEPLASDRLVIERAAGLPPEVVLTVFHVARRQGEDAETARRSLAPGGPR